MDEYWLIDPDQDALLVHRRRSGGFEHVARLSPPDVLTTPLLPGLELCLDRVFA